MSNKEKADLTYKLLQKRKMKRADQKEKEYKDYICKMFLKRKRKWTLKFGGYRR